MTAPALPAAVPAAAPAAPERPPVLVGRGLRVRFGGIEALAGVDLTVHAGEVISVIGPNGAGKSTLFNVICGLVPLSAGQLHFAGHRRQPRAYLFSVARWAAAFAVAILATSLLCDPSALWTQGVLEPHRARLLAERRDEDPAPLKSVGPSFWRALGHEPHVVALRRGWSCEVWPAHGLSAAPAAYVTLAAAAAACSQERQRELPNANARRVTAFGRLVLCTAALGIVLRRRSGARTPRRLAREGLARTFQNIRLFDDLSAFDNVRVVVENGAHPPTTGARQPRRRRARAAREEAHACLARVQLQTRALVPAASLSYGERRRLEIARALALRPRLLLLDEPAAGMHAGETAELLRLVAQLRQQNVAVLLIEHDMQLVMGVSDRVLVLDHGGPIAFGTPDAVVRDPRVIAAYLGQEPPAPTHPKGAEATLDARREAGPRLEGAP